MVEKRKTPRHLAKESTLLGVFDKVVYRDICNNCIKLLNEKTMRKKDINGPVWRVLPNVHENLEEDLYFITMCPKCICLGGGWICRERSHSLHEIKKTKRNQHFVQIIKSRKDNHQYSNGRMSSIKTDRQANSDVLLSTFLSLTPFHAHFWLHVVN